MWRYLVGGLAALLMVGAGALLFRGRAAHVAGLPPAPSLAASGAAAPTQADSPLPATVPEASERTREQKRFDRYDKDRDDKVTRDEYLQQRRKAFAKLDVNHDGQLSFDEWAVKAETKFAAADADRSGVLSRAEFATTAVKRKPPRRGANCPPSPLSRRRRRARGIDVSRRPGRDPGFIGAGRFRNHARARGLGLTKAPGSRPTEAFGPGAGRRRRYAAIVSRVLISASQLASAARPRSVYIRLRSTLLVRPSIGGNRPKLTFIG